jgi:hypothetical protein
LLFKALAEPDEEHADELFVGDWIAEFPKFIGDGLESLAVDTNRSVALEGVAKLSVEAIDAGIDIVLEELTKSRPKSSDSSGVAEHQVEDLGGDVLIDPLNNSKIIFDPTRIMRLWRSGAVDVRSEIATAEVDVKQMNPMIVVVFGYI